MSYITIKYHKLSSLLQTYQILCNPTKLYLKYNLDIYDNLKLTKKYKIKFIDFLKSNENLKHITNIRYAPTNFKSKTLFENRPRIFIPETDDLNDFFSNIGSNIPIIIKKNILKFKEKNISYFYNSKKDIKNIIYQRKRFLESKIIEIYDISKKITKISYKKENINIFIIDSITPGSFVTNFDNNTKYIVTSKRNIKNKEYLLITLIHELIGHESVNDFRKYYLEIFDQFIYNIEEGFVKALTRKISE